MMHELFGIFGSNFWILIFALPGMSKKEALEVVAKIVVKATIEKGKGKNKNTFLSGCTVGGGVTVWSYCVELLLVLLLVELVLVVPMLILVFGVTVVTNSVVSLCFFLHPSPLTTPYHYSIHPRCHVQRSSNHAVSVGRFVEPRRFKFRTRDTVGVDGGAAYGGGDGGREKVRAACRCVGTDVVYTINRR